MAKHPRVQVQMPGDIKTKIHGVTRTDPHSGLDRQEIIKQHVKQGTRLIARLEPDNPVDPNAISLWVEKDIHEQFHIGYLSQERAKELSPYLRQGNKLGVTVINITGGTPDKPTLGINIAIHVSATERKRQGCIAGAAKRIIGFFKWLHNRKVAIPFWGRKLNLSLLGIIVILVLACPCCLIIYAWTDVTARQAGLLPTYTPTPTIAPTSTLAPAPSTETPAPQQPTNTPTLSASTSTPTQLTIETEKGNLIIPGTGFIDGRDQEADPPLTVMNINIWDTAARAEVICQLKHGTEVQLLAAERNEEESRYYIEIQSGTCKGWVSEPFLSPEYHEPEGDEP